MGFWDAVIELIRYFVKEIQKFIQGIKDWVEEKIRLAINGIKNFINEKIAKIYKFVTNIFNNLKKVFENSIKQVREFAENLFNSLKKFFENSIKQVRKWVSRLIKNLEERIKEFVLGIKKGIESKLFSLKQGFKLLRNEFEMFLKGVSKSFSEFLNLIWGNIVIKISNYLQKLLQDFISWVITNLNEWKKSVAKQIILFTTTTLVENISLFLIQRGYKKEIREIMRKKAEELIEKYVEKLI